MAERPSKRAECERVERPCCWTDCRHHLLADESMAREASIRQRMEAGGPSCSLDVADSGGASLEHVAQLLGTTVSVVLRIEQIALRKLRQRMSRSN